MITEEMIDRINQLAKKAKMPEGLTPEETEERQILRTEYIESFKANFKAQLETIEFVEDVEEKNGLEKSQYTIAIEENLE